MNKLLTTSIICVLGSLSTYALANDEEQKLFVEGIKQAEATSKDEIAKEIKKEQGQLNREMKKEEQKWLLEQEKKKEAMRREARKDREETKRETRKYQEEMTREGRKNQEKGKKYGEEKHDKGMKKAGEAKNNAKGNKDKAMKLQQCMKSGKTKQECWGE